MPYSVNTIRDLAAAVRGRRQRLGLTQVELARRARVSRHWLMELEAGKATVELGLAMRVLEALELRLTLDGGDDGGERGSDHGRTADLDALLDEHRRP